MGLANHRDLGGLPTESGLVTRTGRLFRSAAPDPSAGSPYGSRYARVVDLRNGSELGAAGHPLAPYTQVLSLPLLTEADHLWAKDNFDRVDVPTWYTYLVQEYGRRLVQASTACMQIDGPVLVHCAAGKDRTGLLVALLLRLAGITLESVEADYLRSNAHLDERPRPERGPLPDRARPESLHAAVDVWNRSGGVAEWFRRHGGSDELIASWRSSLLRDVT
jgi:protein-tyrosine phosphatase